jgi:hypothetical protein
MNSRVRISLEDGNEEESIGMSTRVPGASGPLSIPKPEHLRMAACSGTIYIPNHKPHPMALRRVARELRKHNLIPQCPASYIPSGF